MSPEITPEMVAAFEAFMLEEFGIEPGVAEDGSHYYERWQIDQAYARETAKKAKGEPSGWKGPWPT